jgi:cytochrome oxidase Cu insertion factor (SCO1/SenC/PrrC family)
MLRRSFALLPFAAWSGLPLGATDVPRKSPDLAVTLPSGKEIRLSDYSGKVLVLSFILTT